MKDSLAERVLAGVMGWGPPEISRQGRKLQTLAAQKYDGYEGYRPGLKFLENLCGWLDQFASAEDREAAVDFVLEQLIFISRAELDHLIETVYPDVIRPMLIREVAAREGIPRFAVRQITTGEKFRQRQRRMLVLGLSDGARIDHLRRSSPGLSHEQIHLASDIGEETIKGALESLRHKQATNDPTARFDQVLLVDDFYGSGFTLLRPNSSATGDENRFKGRLWRANLRLRELAKGEGAALTSDPKVTVLVYIASAQARVYVESALAEAGLDWEFRVVQPLPAEVQVEDGRIAAICEGHYDPILIDDSKPEPAPLGFHGCALPLVLHHNTPNNSIGILWADTTDRKSPPALGRRALFPRYERHRSDRK